jgi:hypothetical protein
MMQTKGTANLTNMELSLFLRGRESQEVFEQTVDSESVKSYALYWDALMEKFSPIF